MKAIIVDDESSTHVVLQRLLLNFHTDISIVGNAHSLYEGMSLLLEVAPDILFLDIELPDGMGFDLLEKIQDPSFQVVFITAHNDYARTAIGFGALDYLLKPINRHELAKALKKARKRQLERISLQQLEILKETLEHLTLNTLPTRIGISTLEGISF